MRPFHNITAFFACIVGVCAFPAMVAAAGPFSATYWRYPSDPQAETEGVSFVRALLGGSMAIGDLVADGESEIIFGSVQGAPSAVTVARRDGSIVTSFAPFTEGIGQSVRVATGDIDGDGVREIVAATGPGVPSRVRLFDGGGNPKVGMPLPAPFVGFGNGTFSVATGDIDGDGKDEVAFGSAAGASSRIELWKNGSLWASIEKPFGADALDGVNVALGDIDGDGKDEIIAAPTVGPGKVRIFDATGFAYVREFVAIDSGFNGGLELAVADMDGDGKDEIIAAPAGFGGPHVHVFSGGGTLLQRFFAFEEPYRGGVLLGAGMFGGSMRIVALRAGRDQDNKPQLAKFVSVDLSEQRLRAYEYGKMVRTFLVSSGLPGTPTPTGLFGIQAKPEFVHYSGRGYDLGVVQYNLRFQPHIYIHNAPWHNNFGRPMSHGCVNVNRVNAQWIFGWADVGTLVSVMQ